MIFAAVRRCPSMHVCVCVCESGERERKTEIRDVLQKVLPLHLYLLKTTTTYKDFSLWLLKTVESKKKWKRKRERKWKEEVEQVMRWKASKWLAQQYQVFSCVRAEVKRCVCVFVCKGARVSAKGSPTWLQKWLLASPLLGDRRL